MLYSSGTTARPKGILRPLKEVPPGDLLESPKYSSSRISYFDDSASTTRSWRVRVRCAFRPLLAVLRILILWVAARNSIASGVPS